MATAGRAGGTLTGRGHQTGVAARPRGGRGAWMRGSGARRGTGADPAGISIRNTVMQSPQVMLSAENMALRKFLCSECERPFCTGVTGALRGRGDPGAGTGVQGRRGGGAAAGRGGIGTRTQNPRGGMTRTGTETQGGTFFRSTCKCTCTCAEFEARAAKSRTSVRG